MAFTAPDLSTVIDGTNYATVIPQKFDLIETAFEQLEAQLANDRPGSSNAISNLNWIDAALGQFGVVGWDSFTLEFGTDDQTVTVSHPDTLSGCIIRGLFHKTGEVFSFDMASLSLPDGVHTLVFGVESLGQPSLAMHVAATSPTDADDADIDLVLYEWDAEVVGGTITPRNLRRRARVVLSAASHESALLTDETLQAFHSGALPAAAGDTGMGFFAPYDCEVLRVYSRLATPPSAGDNVEIKVVVEEGTDDEPVHDDSGTMAWDENQDGDVREAGLRFGVDGFQVAEGQYIKVTQVVADSGSEAAGLTVAVVIRPLYHQLLPR